MLKVKENLQEDLSREPTDGELAEAVGMSVTKMKRELEVGHAARNKIIKVTTFCSISQSYVIYNFVLIFGFLIKATPKIYFAYLYCV